MICFENNGLIELDFVTTFGASKKESGSAIGYFGTGLKYAIAVFLRERHRVTLYRGMDRFDFSVQIKSIRGEDFNIVAMNGEALGFTTELGKNWEPWMAFRELYANAIDEGGTCDRMGDASPCKNKTILAVSGDKIETLFDDKDSIILPSIQPIDADGRVERFGGSNHNLYYKRVRVQDIDPSTYTWSIKSGIDLTEDRTPKYSWSGPDAVARHILTSSDKNLIRECITSPEGTFEGNLDYCCGVHKPSDQFLGAARECSKRGVKIAAKAQQIAEQHCGMLVPDEDVELSRVEAAKLEKAKRIVTALGAEPDYFPIRVTKTLGPGVYGRAHKGTIWLSLFAFEQGTKMVASTLYEEWVHLQFGYGDMTREMQNFLFERIFSLTEEHILGEPI